MAALEGAHEQQTGLPGPIVFRAGAAAGAGAGAMAGTVRTAGTSPLWPSGGAATPTAAASPALTPRTAPKDSLARRLGLTFLL